MYLPRISDAMLSECLNTFGAVLVEGPKWCGKTTSCKRIAASSLMIADPANSYQNKRLAEYDAATALEGTRPRLIDEWQEVPSIWDAARYECDRAGGAPGQFLLTGSATPREREWPLHSGAGRIGRLRMDTLTFQERELSSGKSSLASLFAGGRPAGTSSLTIRAVAEQVCHGGWPGAKNLATEQAMLIARSYIDAVANEDLEKMDGIARSPRKVKGLIVSLARNESTLASKKTLAADVKAYGGTTISESTTNDYLVALEKIFFAENIPAWSPKLRSRTRVRAASKRHLCDVSIAAAALEASPNSLVGDLNTLGLLFESLVAHDLIVYARPMGAEVMHYRDDSGLEVDLIVQKADGAWGAFEVKLGAAQEDTAAKSVLALERKVVERGERPPAVKAVIVGIGGVAHVRNDGVFVIPFDTLGI